MSLQDSISMASPDPLSATAPVRAQQALPAVEAADGTPLVAGLTWMLGGPSPLLLSRSSSCNLAIGDRHASIPEGQGGAASLLVALARALTRIRPDASGTWVFLSAIPDNRVWLALADLLPGADGLTRISPRPAPEELVSAAAGTARAALDACLTVTDITGVVLGPDLDAAVVEGIDLPLEFLSPHVAEEDPRFQAVRTVPPKMLSLLAGGAVALIAATLALPPVMARLFPPPPPVETVQTIVQRGSFATGCTDGQQGWWPRTIGWRHVETGCALDMPDHLALSLPRSDDQLSRPLVIWRSYRLDKTRNAVLAEQASDRMIADWPHHHQRIGSTLVLFQIAPLPLIAAPGENTEAEDAALSRLQRAWADQPEAVTQSSGGFVVTTSGRLSDLLDRVAQVKALTPVRLVSTVGRDSELTLRAPRRVTMPKTLFLNEGRTP